MLLSFSNTITTTVREFFWPFKVLQRELQLITSVVSDQQHSMSKGESKQGDFAVSKDIRTDGTNPVIPKVVVSVAEQIMLWQKNESTWKNTFQTLMERVASLPEKQMEQREKYDVRILKMAARGLSRNFKDPKQLSHVIDLCQRLEDFGKPQLTSDLDIETIKKFPVDIHVLRDRGGPLGIDTKIQLIFFANSNSDEIIITRAYEGWSTSFANTELEYSVELFCEHLMCDAKISMTTPAKNQ